MPEHRQEARSAATTEPQEIERLKAERDRYRELWLAAHRREVARAR